MSRALNSSTFCYRIPFFVLSLIRYCSSPVSKGVSMGLIGVCSLILIASQAQAHTPDAPTGLTADADANGINLSWTAPSNDIVGYSIYRCEEGETPCTPEWMAWVNLNGSDTAPAPTSYTDDGSADPDGTGTPIGLTSGTTYRYEVTANDGDYHESAKSNQVTETAATLPPPPQPTGLTATYDASTTAITLSWTAPSNDIVGYSIYRCEGPPCTPEWTAWVANTGDAPPAPTEYIDTDVTSGAAYRYAVTSNNAAYFESAWSDVVTVQPPTFTMNSYSFNLAENRGRGWQTSAGGLYANDPDGDNVALTYALTAGNPSCLQCGIKDSPYHHNLFRVATTMMGEVRITYQGKGENYESFTSGAAYYTLSLTATDADGATATVTVTINITDMQEPAGNQPPEFPKASYTFNLAENRGRGWQTSAGGLYANDPDGDNVALTYVLTAGNPSCLQCGIKDSPYHHNLFRVATTPMGEARITYQGKGENYESFTSGAAHYTLSLTTTDADSATATVTVTIDITDVQEPAGNQPPEFPKASYTFNLAENRGSGWQTSAGGLYANDPDGDNVALTYALTAGNPSCLQCGIKDSPYHHNLFRVATTPMGEARITYQGTGEDYESFTSGAAHYTLSLTATDADSATTTVTVTIDVIDVLEPALSASFAAGLQWFSKDAFPELSGVARWSSLAWKGERIQQYILIKSIPSNDRISLTASDFDFEANGSDATVTPIPASTVSFLHPHFVKGDTEVRTCAGYPDRDTISYETSYLSDALFSRQQTPQSSVSQNHTVSMDGTNVKVGTQPLSWTVPVWMAIDLPSDTSPGTYSGTVTLSTVSTTSETPVTQTTLQVSIEVVPWSMPSASERQFHLDLWQFPIVALDKYNDAHPEDPVSLWSEDHYGLLEPLYRYLAGLGQQTVSTRAQTMIQWTKTSDGDWEYDYSVFDAHVNKLASWGIDHQISAFSIAYWRDGNVDEFPYWDAAAQENKLFISDIGSSDWEQRWNHFLTDFKNHLVAKEWFNKTVLYMDEVPEASMQDVIDLIQGNDADWKIGLAYGHAPGAHILRELDDSSNTISPVGTRYADDGLTTGMTYRYAVQACSAAGCGDWSDRVTMTAQTPAVPGSPTGVTAAATGDGVIQLNWTPPAATGSSPLTGYNVYRCVDSTSVCSTPTYYAWAPAAASTAYMDNGLTTGTTYRYAVDACNESGCSDWSDPVGIMAQSLVSPPGGTQMGGSTAAPGGSNSSTDELPGAPTGLTAVAAGVTAIQLIWEAPAVTGSSALTGYNVYRCTGPSCTITTSDYLAWTNANERDGQTYPNQVTTFYTSCFQKRPNSFVAADANPVDMVALPWHALERRHDGYGRWAFDNWQSADPLDLREGEFTAGDFSLVFRSSNDKDMTVVPSLRLEALREGMEDFEKIQVLRKSLSTCSAGGVSRRWLSRLERSVNAFTSAALMAGRAGGLINQAHTQLDEVSQQLSPNRCQ